MRKQAAQTERIAITTGEPAGIGPELVAAIAQQAHECELVAIGEPAVERFVELRDSIAGDERERRAHDLVPGANAESHQGDLNRIGSVGDRDDVRVACDLTELFTEAGLVEQAVDVTYFSRMMTFRKPE